MRITIDVDMKELQRMVKKAESMSEVSAKLADDLLNAMDGRAMTFSCSNGYKTVIVKELNHADTCHGIITKAKGVKA